MSVYLLTNFLGRFVPVLLIVQKSGQYGNAVEQVEEQMHKEKLQISKHGWD